MNLKYQKLLTDVIKNQIIVLGPAISLAKARNVKGLTVSEDGTVTAISGNPRELIQQLIDQFMDISALIVKKTIEPILSGYTDLIPSNPNSQTLKIPTMNNIPLSPPSQVPNESLNNTGKSGNEP